MFNQKNQKEKDAINSLLSIEYISSNEIDYDAELKKYTIHKRNIPKPIPSSAQQNSQLIKLVQPLPNFRQQSVQRTSFRNSSERDIIPQKYGIQQIVSSLKTHRHIRNLSEYKHIQVQTIDITNSLQAIHMPRRNCLNQLLNLKKPKNKFPRFILKSKERKQ